MYENAGEKMKFLAKIIFALTFIVGVISGYLLVKSIILGLIIGVFIGGIFGWLNSILLYAFGELCTNVKSIKETITDEDD